MYMTLYSASELSIRGSKTIFSSANGLVSYKINNDKRNDFDIDIVNFPFKMTTFLVVLLMMYTFRNLLGLLESTIMLQTSTLEINV